MTSLAVAALFQAGAGLTSIGGMAAAALGGAVVCWMIADTLALTLFQEAVPSHVQGRIFSLRRALEQFTWPVSSLVTGLMAPAVLRADQFLVLSGMLSFVAVTAVAGLLCVRRPEE